MEKNFRSDYMKDRNPDNIPLSILVKKWWAVATIDLFDLFSFLIFHITFLEIIYTFKNWNLENDSRNWMTANIIG